MAVLDRVLSSAIKREGLACSLALCSLLERCTQVQWDALALCLRQGNIFKHWPYPIHALWGRRGGLGPEPKAGSRHAQLARSAEDFVLCGTAIVRGQKGSECKHTRVAIIYLGAAPLCPQGQHLRLAGCKVHVAVHQHWSGEDQMLGFPFGFFLPLGIGFCRPWCSPSSILSLHTQCGCSAHSTL